jgi:hypothetical protein
MRHRLVEIACREIGTREEGGNNMGAAVRAYQQATWLEPGPWPWCAAFCCWVLKVWLEDPEVLKVITDTIAPNFDAERWRCKDASAFGWEKWAKKKGLRVLPETDLARAGDFVVFDFSHIGIVIEDQQDDFIMVAEGNTNGKGERDSTGGDGVWRKRRHRELVKSYVRII